MYIVVVIIMGVKHFKRIKEDKKKKKEEVNIKEFKKYLLDKRNTRHLLELDNEVKLIDDVLHSVHLCEETLYGNFKAMTRHQSFPLSPEYELACQISSEWEHHVDHVISILRFRDKCQKSFFYLMYKSLLFHDILPVELCQKIVMILISSNYMETSHHLKKMVALKDHLFEISNTNIETYDLFDFIMLDSSM